MPKPPQLYIREGGREGEDGKRMLIKRQERTNKLNVQGKKQDNL